MADSSWALYSNLRPEELSPAEYLNSQGAREQQQEKGVYKVSSKDGNSKTAGNRPREGLLYSLSLCK